MPSILPLSSGHDERRRLGRAGRRRNDRQRRGARAAEVLVRQVEDLLVVRVAVDRRHRAAHETERVFDDLHHRDEAVRGARRVGDDRVLRGVVFRLVHAHHDRNVFALGRRGDDDLLRTAVDVLLGGVGVGEPSGRLEHQIDAQVLPRERGRILLGEDANLVAVDGDRTVFGADLAGIRPVDRVVLEQVRQRFGVRQVVDRHELDVRNFLQARGAQDLPSDAPEAVDSDANRHSVPSVVVTNGRPRPAPARR